MKQAIAGVAPVELGEVTVMTVWPTLAAYGLGRFLGRLYEIRLGVGMFTLGKLIALATIPLVLPYYFLTLLPPLAKRYTLTNRRVVIQRGLRSKNAHYVDLDRFDEIVVRVGPGQRWYSAGDLVFMRAQVETFRLEGVSRPQTFRHTCMKARDSHVGVSNAIGRELAAR